MNKSELVKYMAQDADITQAQAAKALDSFVDRVTAALKAGDSASFVGFGTFKVVTRQAREGRNPKTGKSIKIDAKKVARFVPGKKLKETVEKAK